jgi:ectoine hydroxylase-related dioxygenase (phytanoyl-CoA dioxygenase family)
LRAGLGAGDLKWISGYVSLKEPHSPALWWHQDWWCWDHPISYRRAAAQVAVLCYLGDTTADNGALRVLPGSHYRSLPIHAALPEPHTAVASGLEPAHPALRDHPEQLTLCLSPGDAVVLDYRLLHGTHANASESRRDCVLLSFAPSWSELPEEIRGHLINHPAQPATDERPSETGWETELLPRFYGVRGDLPVNRRAPDCFSVVDPDQGRHGCSQHRIGRRGGRTPRH